MDNVLPKLETLSIPFRERSPSTPIHPDTEFFDILFHN